MSDPKPLTWLRVDGNAIFLKSTPVEAEEWLSLLDEIPDAVGKAQRLERRRIAQWKLAGEWAGLVPGYMVVLGHPGDPMADAITIHVETDEQFDAFVERHGLLTKPGTRHVSWVLGYRVAVLDVDLAIHVAVKGLPPQDDRPAPDATPDPDAPQWAPPLSSPPVSQSVNVAAGVTTEFRSPWQDTTPLAPVTGLFPTPAPHVRVVPPRLTRGWRL